MLHNLDLEGIEGLKRERIIPEGSSCNIYEAGSGVKPYFKHTAPLAARVRHLAKYIDLLRMRRTFVVGIELFLVRSPCRVAIPSSIRALLAHEVHFALSP